MYIVTKLYICHLFASWGPVRPIFTTKKRWSCQGVQLTRGPRQGTKLLRPEVPNSSEKVWMTTSSPLAMGPIGPSFAAPGDHETHKTYMKKNRSNLS